LAGNQESAGGFHGVCDGPHPAGKGCDDAMNRYLHESSTGKIHASKGLSTRTICGIRFFGEGWRSAGALSKPAWIERLVVANSGMKDSAFRRNACRKCFILK
jgi:hypothetical protein